MKSVIVGFSYRPKNLLSWGIRKVEKTEFSHVYIMWYSESIQRFLVYQASHSMVNFMSYESFKAQNTVVEEYEIQLEHSAFTRMVQYCVDNAGKPYGVLNLTGLSVQRLTGLKNPLTDGDRSFVCCELVGRVLQEAGITLGLDLNLAGLSELHYHLTKMPKARKLSYAQ